MLAKDSIESDGVENHRPRKSPDSRGSFRLGCVSTGLSQMGNTQGGVQPFPAQVRVVPVRLGWCVGLEGRSQGLCHLGSSPWQPPSSTTSRGMQTILMKVVAQGNFVFAILPPLLDTCSLGPRVENCPQTVQSVASDLRQT